MPKTAPPAGLNGPVREDHERELKSHVAANRSITSYHGGPESWTPPSLQQD